MNSGGDGSHALPTRLFGAEKVIGRNHATVLWIYRKAGNGQLWILRGVDVFTVRDGKIAAKLAYVKG